MTKSEIENTLRDFKIYLEREELCERTVNQYLRGIGKLLLFGENAVDKDFMLAYKKHLMETYRPASVNLYPISANKFFRWCGKDSLTVKTNRLPCERNLENVITEEEYKQMLSFTRQRKKEKAALIIRTLACTGIRVSELQYITGKTVAAGKAVFFSKGRYRTILLPESLKSELSSYCGKTGIADGPVFHGRDKKYPLASNSVWGMLKRLSKASGIDPSKVYPHSFRHLFAKTYMAHLGNVMELADLLGHASIETTRIYTVTSIQEKKRALDSLGL